MIIDGARRDWLRRRPRLADSLLALVVFVLAVIVMDPDATARTVDAALDAGPLLLAAATCAVLVLRRDHPDAVLVGTVLGTVTCTLLVGQLTLLYLAAMIALYTVAVRGERRRTRLAFAGTVLMLTAADALARRAVSPELLPTVAWALAAASSGDAIGHRRAYLAAMEDRAVRAEQGREEESRRRVAEERLRIARELHDVVAHHMAVVNVQAGVAAYLLPDQPLAAQEALGHVRRAAGDILNELGDILNVLRQGDDPAASTVPAPGLAQLDDLVTSFSTAGLDVDWSLTGRPQGLATGVDLVAYRVLQEALTNAHKHGAGTAHLSVAYLPDQVRLRVSNPVAVDGAESTPPPPGGHGLLGMRERTSAVGGTLQTGDDGHGSFRVQAVLPLPVPT